MTRLRLLVVFCFAVPLFGGTFERFPLPRTVTSPGWQMVAGADALWIQGSSGLVECDLDGEVVATPALSANVMVADPSDGSLWLATAETITHVPLSGAPVSTYVSQLWRTKSSMTFGPDDALWFTMAYRLFRVTRDLQTVTEFALNSSGVANLLAGADGNLWAIDYDNGAVLRITTTGTVTPFGLGGSEPSRMTKGADGKMWVTTHDGKLFSVTSAGTVTPEYTGTGDFTEITLGSDGFLYFGDAVGNINKYQPGVGVVSTYDVGDTRIFTLVAVAGGVWWTDEAWSLGKLKADGTFTSSTFTPYVPSIEALVSTNSALWFLAANSDRIGRMETNGTVTTFDLPTANADPGDLAVGADGNVWVTESAADRIARINVATGVITEFPVLTAGSQPGEITLGADGNLWFTMIDKIGRITTAGVVSEFALPAWYLPLAPNSITTGVDGNVWYASRRIGRVTPAGEVTEFHPGGDGPHDISAGPDGKLWYLAGSSSYRMDLFGNPQNLGNLPIGSQRIVGPDGLLWYATGSLVRLYADLKQEILDAPVGQSFGAAIVTGPDNHVWVSGIDAIHRVTLDAPMSASAFTHCLAADNTIFGTLATFNDPDATRNASFYEARVRWDSLLPSSGMATVTQTAPGQFTVTGETTYPYAGPRSYIVEITALPGPNRIGGRVWATGTVNSPVPEQTTYTRPGSGGEFTIPLQNVGTCEWTASSNRSWIVVPANGTESPLNVSILVNDTKTARSGTISIGGYVITINQTAEASTRLYLVTPCRLIDTRNSNVKLAPGVSEDVSATGRCGISSDAAAIVANLTVVAPADNGWLAAYRAGSAWPGISTINFRAGKTRANNAVIPLNFGAFSVFNGASVPVHFIVDVTGYFQ